MHEGTRIALAVLERERAEFEAKDRLAAQAAQVAGAALQPRPGPSVVLTLRLDRPEYEARQRRAAHQGLRPGALVRNLIRQA